MQLRLAAAHTQEGREGQPSRCRLAPSPTDHSSQRFRLKAVQPYEQGARRVHRPRLVSPGEMARDLPPLPKQRRMRKWLKRGGAPPQRPSRCSRHAAAGRPSRPPQVQAAADPLHHPHQLQAQAMPQHSGTARPVGHQPVQWRPLRLRLHQHAGLRARSQELQRRGAPTGHAPCTNPLRGAQMRRKRSRRGGQPRAR